MKLREGIKWAAVSYLLTLATMITILELNKMAGVSRENVMAQIASFMITQLCPLTAIILVLLPYSIFTRRWQAILGACVGNIAFFPLTVALAMVFGVVVGFPVTAWQEGWHAAVIALIIAYCMVAFVLTRKWIKRRRSQPATAPYSEPASRSPQG